MSIFDLLKKHAKPDENAGGPPEYIIACLGNPGKKYAQTRHNAGYMAADYIAEKLSVSVNRSKFDSLCGQATVSGKKVLIMKPLTFMNNSGLAVRQAADFYKIPPEKILVIFDDVNIAPGNIRIKRSGTDGGHNGIKSIIYHLSSDSFPRIKIGVGMPEHGEMIDWVIGRFPEEDREPVFSALGNVCDAMTLIVAGDMETAMAKYNRK